MDCFRGGFDEYEAYFVHIPKSAGSSVSLSLFGYQVGHLTYEDIFYLNKSKAKKYFSFTFVRNPIDRFVSAYAFLKAGGMNERDLMFSKENLLAYNDINEFVFDLTSEMIESHLHFMPQYKFLCSDASIYPQVKFIGRFENIENDFEYITKKLDIKAKLQEINTTDKSSANVTLTKKSMEKLQRLYSIDYYLFGYNLNSRMNRVK
jgi:hypothetical protein